MSSQTVSPTRALAEVDHRAAVAGLEVALLVEDAVVRQPHLAVDRLAPRRRRSTATALKTSCDALGEADDRDDPLGVALGDARAAPRARRAGSAPSAAGPRAGSRSAPARGRGRARAPALAGAPRCCADPRGVALEVADAGCRSGRARAGRVGAAAMGIARPCVRVQPRARRGRSRPRRSRAARGRPGSPVRSRRRHAAAVTAVAPGARREDHLLARGRDLGVERAARPRRCSGAQRARAAAARS